MGVRLGYLAAEPAVVTAARQLQPVWSVNSVAQSAGAAALKDDAHVAAARRVIMEAKAYLVAELELLGLDVVASATNSVLARVGDAANLRSSLLRLRIAVRDCTSFGLPEYIRIGVRRAGECARLVEALPEVLANE